VLYKYHIRTILTFDLKKQLHHRNRSKRAKRRENEKITPKTCVRFVFTESSDHSYQVRAALKSQQEIQDISERLVGYNNWLLFLYIEMAYDA